MKKTIAVMAFLMASAVAHADGWPQDYGGVMLQGFYWDSYQQTAWQRLESQADELSRFFCLVWVPQSGRATTETSMGYNPLYYYDQTSTFGTEAQLKSMISTLKGRGVGVIADVVVNHRGNVSNWVDFPAEVNPSDGKTYQMVSTDICANDDGGATKAWADQNGYSLSSNSDEGDDWSGMRDLDHKSANVQENVRAYCKYLIDYLGYTGFRYDMVKGFSPTHVADYNAYAGAEYSVGEYWDGNASVVKSWISRCLSDGARQSAAFDFPFRYTVRDAVNGNWAALANNSLMSDPNYRQYAVTFVENHDTEYRSATAQQDPIKKDTLAANAFMMAMPGTPCVFLKHWIDCKADIKNLILARKLAGISNTSAYTVGTKSATLFTTTTTGTGGRRLFAAVGTSAGSASAPDGFALLLSGNHYRYYLSRDAETAWASVADCDFSSPFEVTLTAISATDGARLVYTTDGTTPTATNGTTIDSGSTIAITETTTLQVGLLVGGSVAASSVITRQYNASQDAPFEPYDITIYVNIDKAGWSDASYVNYHSWGGDGSHGTSWPGKRVEQTTTIDGRKWFYNTYRINSADDFVSFVFSQGTSSTASGCQTVDVGSSSYGYNQTAFFEVDARGTATKYPVNDVSSSYTVIRVVKVNEKAPVYVFTTDGRLVRRMPSGTSASKAVSTLPRGVYVVGGKKVMK